MAAASKPIDRWIPYMFVAFFAVIILVDGTMATLAIRTNTGTVTDDAYNQGLNYNQTIADEEKQDKLGWKVDVSLKDKKIILSLLDKNKKPLENARVSILVTRPVQAGYDQKLQLVNAGNGHYSQALDLPFPGQWEAYIDVTLNKNTYRTHKLLIAP